MPPKNRRASKDDDPSPCSVCAALVTTKGLCCDYCNRWLHTSCVNMDDKVYSVINSLEQLYFCPSCLPTAKRLIQLESRMANLEQKFDTFTDNINKKLDKIIASDFGIPPLQNFPTISTSNNMSSKNTTPALSDMIISAVNDALEAESKKSTVVLENFTNNSDSTLEDDVKTFITSAGGDASKIVNIRRSGPVLKSRQGSDLPRIVKVKCDSETSKKDIIIAVTKFADKGRHSKIRARPDRTWQQRETLRKLRQELIEHREKGEQDYFIDYNRYKLIKVNRIHRP